MDNKNNTKKKVIAVILVILALAIALLFLLKGCQKEEPVIHTHSYKINEEGTWICNDDSDILSNTDKPYVAILEDNQPKDIMAIDSLSKSKINLGNGTIYKDGNNIYYSGNNAQTVIIKTQKVNDKQVDKDNLVINAPNDTVYHYGSSTVISLDAVATNSFHEYGKVELITLTKARVVLENPSDVKEIYLDINNSNYSYETTIIALKENVELPRLTRDAVDLEEGEVKTLAIVQKLKDEVKTETNTETNEVIETVLEVQAGNDDYVKIENVRKSNDELIIEAFLSPNAKEDDKTKTDNQSTSTITLEEAKEGSSHPASHNTFVPKEEKVTEVIKPTETKEEQKQEETKPTVKPTKKEEPNPEEETPAPVPPTPAHTHSDSDNDGICDTCHDGADVKIEKAGETITYKKFDKFRDSVNGGSTYAGYTVTLLHDIDLNNVEWTPIGTEEHPFSGVFDGDNHTISNLKITNYSTSNGVGLFGNLVGDDSKPKHYSDLSEVWNNGTLNLNFFDESNYSARVLNINISGFDISSSKDYTGTLVGYARDAYIRNSLVSKGTITAPGKLGGVVGATASNMAIKDLISDSNVLIIGTKHSVGGIIGGFNRDYNGNPDHNAAAINCINNASIINNSDGIAGGIIGHFGSTSRLNGFVYGCVNNGNISLKNDGTNTRVGGIVADGDGIKVIADCTNNGNIDVLSTNTSWYVAGISTYTKVGGTIFYNCVNNGDITAFAQRLAGITALENDGSEMTNCKNNGILSNTNPDGATYQLTGGHYSTQTYESSTTPMTSIDEVNSKIDDSFAIYNFKGYGQINGELVIDSTKSYVTITADSKICSSVSIKNPTTQTVILDIPGISCTVSGDMSGLTLVLKGENNKFTLTEGSKILKLQLEGDESTATINGEITNLNISGNNSVSEISLTGKCERVGFSGTGNYTLTNRGLISCTCGDQWGTWHVVTTQSPCTITINNYGTIETKTGQYGRCAYALLFYNGCNVVFNAYSGSTLSCDHSGYIIACWSSNSVTFNYQEGASLINGTKTSYDSMKGGKITVNKIN